MLMSCIRAFNSKYDTILLVTKEPYIRMREWENYQLKLGLDSTCSLLVTVVCTFMSPCTLNRDLDLKVMVKCLRGAFWQSMSLR